MPETGASESGSTRAAAVLQTHLDHLERPLRYATRQNFAHLAKLRDLEAYVQHHVQALQASPLPPELPLLQQLLRCRMSMHYLCHRNRSACGRLSRCWPRCEPMPPTLPEPSPATSAVQAPAQATTHPVVQESQDKSDPCAQSVQFLRGVGPRRAARSPKCHSTRYTISCGAPHALRRPPPAHAFRTAAMGQAGDICGTVTTLQTQPSKNVGNRLWLCYCRTTVAP